MTRPADGAGSGVLGASEAWERLLGIRTSREAEAAGLVLGTDAAWRWGQEATLEAQRLADLYVPLCLAGRRHVFAQLGQSLDGCIATRTGDAVYVTGEEDRRHLHRLRALADAVIVGADTVMADDPRLTVRACSGTNPLRVVLDPRGRVPRDRRVFTDCASPTLWVLGSPDSGVEESRGQMRDVEIVRVGVPDGANGFAPHKLLELLAQRGLGRVLVEGGGVTVSRFLREGALQRLFLTVAPVLVGNGVPGLHFPGSSKMSDALRAPMRRVHLGDDTLFELDLQGLAASSIAAEEA